MTKYVKPQGTVQFFLDESAPGEKFRGEPPLTSADKTRQFCPIETLSGEMDYGCGAELSSDGIYRYALTREWEDGRCVAWLMFNPSTADAEQDDATIRKCVGFSKRWGYGRMVVVNLYAVRSRDPKTVARIADPVGPLNNYWIAESLKESRELVCAWGCAQHMSKIGERINEVMFLARGCKTPIVCLGQRRDSHPRHPLMLPYSTNRKPYTPF